MHSPTALQCWGTTPSLSCGSRPCLTTPARPWRESRARSTAGMGLAVGYLRSCQQALTPCVCQSPPLSSPALLGGVPPSPTAPDPAHTPWSQVVLKAHFPAHLLAQGLCQQAEPGTGQQQDRRPHIPCVSDRPGCTKKDNVGAGRCGRNRKGNGLGLEPRLCPSRNGSG